MIKNFLLFSFLIFSLTNGFAQGTNGLVAYYPFTGNAADSSGNHHDGTIIGGVTLTADRFGNPNSAYHFDGSSGYISCPNDSNLLKSKNFSYTVWFRVQNRPSWDQNVILANIGGYLNSGGFEAFTSNPPGTYASMFRNATHYDQQLTGTDSIQPNVWYQLMVMARYDSLIDSTTVINYIDCVFDDSARFAGSINYDAISPFYIGANLDIACCQRYFLGDIDEVKVYDIAIGPCSATITCADTVNLIQSLCPNDSLLFYGAWIHNYGVYDTLIHTLNTCDSLIILSLPVIDPLPPTRIYDTICHGDSVLFNGIYVDTAGIYNAHFKPQSGCDSMVILNLTVRPQPVINISSSKNIFCPDDSAQICATGSFNSYLWNTEDTTGCIEVKAAGNYYVTVTDASNCVGKSVPVAIQVYPEPSISIVIQGDTLSSFGANTYQWYLNDTIISYANASIFVANASGNYTLEISDTNGCIAISNPVNIILTGITILIKTGINIYPNPAHDYLIVEYNGFTANSQIEIVDVLGGIVKNERVNSKVAKVQVDIYSLSNGLYFIRIVENGVVKQQGKFSVVR